MIQEMATAGRVQNSGILLPIRICKETEKPRSLSLPCFKIIFIENGVGIMAVNGTRRVVQAASIVCLNDRESAVFDGDIEFSTLLFLPNVVNELLSANSIHKGRNEGWGLSTFLDLFWAKLFSGSRTRPLEIPLTPVAAKVIKQSIEKTHMELTTQENPFWPCRARSYLIELLILIGRLFHDLKEIPNIPGPESELAPVLMYIHTNYGEKITVQNLARRFFTNRNSLQKKFLQTTGTSIGIYIRELRFSIARSLLKDTKLPIGAILEKAGFCDATHFIRAFRKRFGMTPLAFRKNQFGNQYQLAVRNVQNRKRSGISTRLTVANLT